MHFGCCCFLKCLTLLFFCSQMNVSDHQFPVCVCVCVGVNSRWFIPLAVPRKVERRSVKWVSLSCWCPNHFSCCAEATTAGSVVTFCVTVGAIFSTSHTCREGGRNGDPPAASPSQLHGVSEVFMAASSGRCVGTHCAGGQVKTERVFLAVYFRSEQSVLAPAGGALLLDWDPGAVEIVKRIHIYLASQFPPAFANECRAAVVWGKLFGSVEQRQNNHNWGKTDIKKRTFSWYDDLY